MRFNAVLGALLALLALAMPASGLEPVAAQDERVGQFHGLSPHGHDDFALADPGAGRPLITLMLRHRDQLGLTPDQVQALERLRSDFQREAIRREADLRVAEMDLATLLSAEVVDLGQAEAKLREIERLRTDLRLARIRTIEQGRAQLSPEQRAKLRALMGEPRPPRLRSLAPPPRGEQR